MMFQQHSEGIVVLAWSLTLLVSVFVALRIYARLVLVSWFGLDDMAYLLAFLFLILFNITFTISIAATQGQGQVPNPDDVVKALFYDGLGINLMAVGMVLAKCSLGFFLLRIVQETRQKAAIWAVMLLLLATSIACCVSFWLQCRPVSYTWDRRIEGAVCNAFFRYCIIAVTSMCVFADFFFVVFPWIVLWKIKMNRRDKILILSSLSLGVFAGGFGVKRTIGVVLTNDAEYAKGTDTVATWSIAEIAVTMVCIGIPVCLPVFRMMLGKRVSNDSNNNNLAARYPSSRSRENELQGDQTSTMTGMARKMGIPWTETVFPLEGEERDDIMFQIESGESREQIVEMVPPERAVS
ncbi:hypothetical protein B0J13DRAFT_504558 [Dactylonectria estremocensis]|uniref:Rhodopsin domain-containing protein n=1 Tax=Dactylonectria estremocensis TaxID=1079267 RepID=A0A9P9J352_9HYPO|nr:hypothetical protein B0J13DRAFT_504558 [Dactylonectria estremocensis]